MTKRVLRYLRQCYQADHSRLGFLDVFHRNVEHLIFLKEEEALFSQQLDMVPLVEAEARDAARAAFTYQKEKDMVHGTLILVGHIPPKNEDDKGQFVCAPLLLQNVRLVETREEGVVWVEPEVGTARLNHHLLAALPLAEGADNLASALWDILGHVPLTDTDVLAASNLLDDVVSGFVEADAVQYPTIVDEKSLRSQARSTKRKKQLTLVSASMLALIKRGIEARGVLSELESLAELEKPATPIRKLFDLDEEPTASETVSDVWQGVPVVLSGPQCKVLENAVKHPVSLVIGPPGTGKSFTIAALAVEHITRGARVLVASKMNHAVDVVAAKINEMITVDAGPVRGGRRQYMRELKAKLEHLTRNPPKEISHKDVLKLQLELEKSCKALLKTEATLEKFCERELEWGATMAERTGGIWGKVKQQYVRFRTQQHAEDLGAIQIAKTAWEKALNTRRYQAKRLAEVTIRNRLAHRLHNHRKDFRTFLGGIRARTGTRQEALFDKVDFQVILDAFPIWLVNLAHVSDVLPFRQELFDLAIIDEASQCDMASCLPLMQRAKRVVFVGDPCQLRHISFLSRDRQRLFAEKHQLLDEEMSSFDYRERSILDLVNDKAASEEVVFLDEHFRSEPPIIAFSNRHFYNNGLHLITQKPGVKYTHALKLIRCDGERDEHGVNHGEINQILADIQAILKTAAESGVPTPSIGVLSPFRDQVDALAAVLTEHFSFEQRTACNLLVGTAHTFQGEERDQMFLSLSLDKRFHSASLRFLENEGVFNVSITRARLGQHVYCSLDPATLSAESLLRKYLEHILQSQESGAPLINQQVSMHCDFSEEVAEVLMEKGFEVKKEHPCSGMTIDLVAFRNSVSILIDLIGYPGETAGWMPLERYRMLGRAGMQIVLLPYSLWVINRTAAIALLEQAFGVASRLKTQRK